MLRVARDDFANAPSMYEDEPVVVQDVLSMPKCDQWWDHISTRSHKEMVQVTQQRKASKTKLLLAQATKLVASASSHGNPLFLTSIGSSCSTDQLPLYDTLEELFVNPDTDFEDRNDWFAYLGRHAPTYDTLVVSGEGSTFPNAISSHPFTKTILCLQGSQLLRVLPPNGDIAKKYWNDDQTQNKAKQAQQPPQPIWGESWEGFPYSLGSQLNPSLNLFAYRHSDVEAEPPSAYPHYAEDPTQLHPSFAMPPIEYYDWNNHDSWYSGVVLPGDVAVIPPGWWYQAYNAEKTEDDAPPGVCVLSQRCGGSPMGAQLVQHLLDSAFDGNSRLQLIHEDPDYYYTMEEAQDLVDKVFDVLQDHYEENDENSNNDPTRSKKKSQSER